MFMSNEMRLPPGFQTTESMEQSSNQEEFLNFDPINNGQLHNEIPTPTQKHQKKVGLLTKYHIDKVPGMHVMLPSKNRQSDNITLSLSGEVDVRPMSPSDELITKNPDALLSGAATEQLITNCVPSVADPKELLASDMEVLLAAIRYVTYGNTMSYEVKCPKCNEDNKVDVSIRDLLETITFYDTEYKTTVGDVTIYIEPLTYADQFKLGVATFQEAKKLQMLNDDSIDAKIKTKQFTKTLTTLHDLMNDLKVKYITKIVVPDGEVTDKDEIKEFLIKSSAAYADAIKRLMDNISAVGLQKTVSLTCQNTKCNHKWDAPLGFDPTTFFT